MHFLKSAIIATSLLASSAYGDGFGFNLGPFNMQFGTYDGGGYQPSHRVALDSPICHAISDLKRLEIIVEQREDISTKERKIVTKKLIVEPYAFGITKDGKPVLRGNVVEEKLVREVSIKFGEDTFNKSEPSPKQKEKSYFSGMFSSDKSQNIDIQRISNIRVIEDSQFDAPKNYKGIEDENIQVICQLTVDAKK